MSAQSKTVRWVNRPPGSNWGDFGPDDQIGRMNLLTDAMRLAAIREVKDGRVFALSLPLDVPGGHGLTDARQAPRIFASRRGDTALYNLGIGHDDVCCDDAVTLHTQYSTQWDSLAHWGRMFDADGDGIPEAVYYNGFRGGEHLIGEGVGGGCKARALGIENLATTGVQGRGVLVDLTRDFGRGRTAIGRAQLTQALQTQKCEVRTGDFLVLYTGFADALLAMAGNPDRAILTNTGAVLDGSDEALLEWIDRSGIVAICSDNFAIEGLDHKPQDTGGKGSMPIHDLCLFKLGIHLGEMWWLHDLARALREADRTAFLLTAPPLRLPGAVGSPVTPVATF